MALDALVFDFDGLILDTELPEFVTVRDEFSAHGLELRLEDWQQIVGRADHPHWIDWIETELGRPVVDRELVRARRAAQHHAMISEQVVLPGVLALLEQAEADGLGLAVASSSPRSWVAGHLDRLGLHDRFAVIRTRDDVERAKPWPDLFTAAVDALGVAPAAAVAFEDSRNGSLAAKAAGLYCVVAPNEITRSQDFSHADQVVGSLAEVTVPALALALDAATDVGSG
jgi:HAD superfamily hydrolase (TIGR01509 family)